MKNVKYTLENPVEFLFEGWNPREGAWEKCWLFGIGQNNSIKSLLESYIKAEPSGVDEIVIGIAGLLTFNPWRIKIGFESN